MQSQPGYVCTGLSSNLITHWIDLINIINRSFNWSINRINRNSLYCKVIMYTGFVCMCVCMYKLVLYVWICRCIYWTYLHECNKLQSCWYEESRLEAFYSITCQWYKLLDLVSYTDVTNFAFSWYVHKYHVCQVCFWYLTICVFLMNCHLFRVCKLFHWHLR